MPLLEIAILGLGLSMDAFAVSVSNGIVIKKAKLQHALLTALFFGGFQAGMPVIGWAAGNLFAKLVQCADHWIAFGLLSFIGIKMIYESMHPDENNGKRMDLSGSPNGKTVKMLFILAVATSIDALAVGISFSFLNISIILPVLMIGAITFIMSLCGIYLGGMFGHFFENKLEIVGGAILILIGLKILLEHLLA